MRPNIKITTVLLLLLLIAGCKGTPKKTAGSTESATVSDEQGPLSAEDIYHSLPTLGLPLESGDDLWRRLHAVEPLAEADFHRITGTEGLKSNDHPASRAVRLPEKDGNRFILSGYSEGGEWIIDLYSLGPALDPRDRLRLHSSERVANGDSLIRQTFVLKNDFRTEVSKRLSGVLIERLTYLPTAEGHFEELRDGKTTTVAFDSYDGLHYIVQTFIWDHNESAGLVRKDPHTENYRLQQGGKLIKTESGTR